MKEKQDEIEELFAMFHDFDIVGAERIVDALVLFITIPWGSMWKENDYSYTIRLELLGCSHFSCEYYLIKSDKLTKINDNHYQRDTEKLTTSDIDRIVKLHLSIQNSSLVGSNSYELHCISDENIDFATISLVTSDYQIFDQEGKEINLETMQQWAKDWWDSIQRMWDENKK